MVPFWIGQFITLLLNRCFSSRSDKVLKNNFLSIFKGNIDLKSLMLFGSGLPYFGDVDLSSNSPLNLYNTIFKTSGQMKQIITNIAAQLIYFIKNHVDSRSTTILLRVRISLNSLNKKIFICRRFRNSWWMWKTIQGR